MSRIVRRIGTGRGSAGHRWAIVLAGGFGRRLQGVTESFAGKPVPKQFCPFGTDRSLLQRTLDRTAPLVPRERTVVVVDRSMHDLAAGQLRGYRGVTLIDQPRERGTGAGILLPLMRVLDLDPAADVVLVPSDHHFGDAGAFHDPIQAAFEWVEREPGQVCLLGVEPDRAATDLGWIVPHRTTSLTDRWPLAHVERFLEKPPAAIAAQLYGAGALWNTMIVTARGTELLRLFRRWVPTVARIFLAGGQLPWAARVRWLRRRYALIPRADFSADVLARASNLRVLAVSRLAGWSDLGTPERLYEWIAGHRRAAGGAELAAR